MGKDKSTKQKGLYLRNGVYYCRIAGPDGTMVRKRLSREKGTAITILAEMRKQVELQRAGVLPDTITDQIKTMSVLRDRYQLHISGKVSQNTMRNFDCAWRQVVQRNQIVKLADMTLPRVEAWARDRLREGTRGQSINNYVIAVNSALKWAHNNGYIRRNPLAGWRPVRISEPKARRDLRPEEVHAVLLTETDPEWRLRWLVYFFTGLRNSAGRNIEWEWLDWNGDFLHIPLEENKSQKPLKVPLHPLLRRGLEQWRDRRIADGLPVTGKIFRPLTSHSIRLRFRQVCQEAKLDITGLTLHSIRHTFATTAYEGTGKNIKAVQELLGHSNAAITMRYLHLTNSELHGAIQAVDYGIKFIQEDSSVSSAL